MEQTTPLAPVQHYQEPPTPVWISVQEQFPPWGFHTTWCNQLVGQDTAYFQSEMRYDPKDQRWIYDNGNGIVPPYIQVTHWLDFRR